MGASVGVDALARWLDPAAKAQMRVSHSPPAWLFAVRGNSWRLWPRLSPMCLRSCVSCLRICHFTSEKLGETSMQICTTSTMRYFGLATVLALQAALGQFGLGRTASAQTLANGDFQTSELRPASSTYHRSGTMWQEGSWNVVSYDTLHPFWADFFDHTFGDRRGWYLVVNGSTSPAGSVWSQTVEVTPGTEYRLGAWFASV